MSEAEDDHTAPGLCGLEPKRRTMWNQQDA
jgi:hypothetical protein